MRSQFNGRRRTSAALGILLALVVAGGAFAYWTIGGTGSGTAQAGTAGMSLQVTQMTGVTGLYPAGPAQALSVRITNPNTSPVKVGDLSATVVSTSNVGCGANNFAVSVPVSLGGATIGAGAFIDDASLEIWMLETDVNQNACQNATVNLSFSVSAY